VRALVAHGAQTSLVSLNDLAASFAGDALDLLKRRGIFALGQVHGLLTHVLKSQRRRTDVCTKK